MSIAPAIDANPRGRQPVESKEAKQTTGATFQTSNAKFYFPVVTLSINDDIRFLENYKKIWKNNFLVET